MSTLTVSPGPVHGRKKKAIFPLRQPCPPETSPLSGKSAEIVFASFGAGWIISFPPCGCRPDPPFPSGGSPPPSCKGPAAKVCPLFPAFSCPAGTGAAPSGPRGHGFQGRSPFFRFLKRFFRVRFLLPGLHVPAFWIPLPHPPGCPDVCLQRSMQVPAPGKSPLCLCRGSPRRVGVPHRFWGRKAVLKTISSADRRKKRTVLSEAFLFPFAPLMPRSIFSVLHHPLRFLPCFSTLSEFSSPPMRLHGIITAG